MRHPAQEKLEIIRLVEQSHIPAKQTLDRLGIPRSTFYLWYDKYVQGGAEALEDKAPMPAPVWNQIPDDVRKKIVKLALKETNHRESFPLDLRTPSATSYQRLAFTGCSRRMI